MRPIVSRATELQPLPLRWSLTTNTLSIKRGACKILFTSKRPLQATPTEKVEGAAREPRTPPLMSGLTAREQDFLRQSDALAGRTLPDDEDAIPTCLAGHEEAWLLLKQRAQARATPTLDDLIHLWALLTAPTTPVPEALPELCALLSQRVDEPGSPRDYYGGHTIFLAGLFLQRFLSAIWQDGRFARLMANYVLVRRGWPMVVFRTEDSASLEAASHSDVAMGALLVDKVREIASCGHCRTASVARTQVGLTVDAYRCDACGAEFKLDWKGLQNAYRLATDPSAAPLSPSEPSKMPSRFILRNR